MTPATTLLLVLVLLQIKHLLADYVWQSETMVRKKGIYGDPVGATHSLLHAALTGLILLAVTPLTLPVVAGIVLFEFVVHYHTDWCKDFLTFRSETTPREKRYWILVGLDQFMHQITYIVVLACVMVAMT